MGKLKLIFCCIAIGFCTNIKAADTTINLQEIKVIEGDIKNFAVDNLENTYLISSSNKIKKLSKNFDSIGVYNDVKRFGNISYIDVTNALKILIFYKDFSTIVVLDRQLAIKNIISLSKLNLVNVNSIALSYDNNIWIFDELNARIKKIDETGKLLYESNDLRMALPNDNYLKPEKIIDYNNNLYLCNSKNGCLVFDYYGAIKNKLPNVTLQNIQCINNVFIGTDSLNFWYYPKPYLIGQKFKTNISVLNCSKSFFTQSNKAFLLFKNSLKVYVMGNKKGTL